MIIVIPMAGKGRRFVEAGYAIPKPLLPLHGHPLVWWAVESTNQLHGRYHYLLNETIAHHPLKDGVLPSGCWHVILEDTRGPLQTVLHARACLEVDDELLIMDCDSVLDAQELAEAVEVFRASGAMGGVTVRRTTDPMCSYAEIDAEWWVSQTREKDPFTPWSTTGPYWFKSSQQFLEAATKAASAQHVSISPVYNYLEGKTKAVPVASFRHFGTPEAYESALKEVLV